MDSLNSFIRKNLIYPKPETEIQGSVIVNFVVEKDGTITNAKVLKSVTPDFDAEALRLVNMMPAWKPSKQRGKEVRVFINLPIRFVLE